LLIKLHEGFGHGLGQLGVHREVFAAPVHAVAHAAHLAGDGVARFFFPLPHLAHKVLARFGGASAHIVPADAFGLQLALHHDLRGNACVISARNPCGVEAGHAVVAGQAVHDGLVERVAHVQGARYVGRWQLNGEGWCVSRRGACATEACHTVAALFPLGAPMGFKGGGLERFRQALKAGLFEGEGGRVAHRTIQAKEKRQT
jgi:hypothetical protein